MVTIHGKMSQNEKKMREYKSLKDVLQNSFGLVLRELLDVSLYLETTHNVRPLFCGRISGLRGQVLLYIYLTMTKIKYFMFF